MSSSSEPFKPTALQFTPTTRHSPYPFISPKTLDLTSRSVFITGASRGIGHATALAYAAAGASQIAIGARTALTDLVPAIETAAKNAGRKPPTVLPLAVDVTDVESVKAAAAEVDKAFGGLDVLVNNAGYLEPWMKIADSDADQWGKVWDVNIKGVYLVTRAFLPLVLKKKEGLKTVVNISSVGALFVMPGASGYQATKLALLRFGEFVNAEYGDQGVVCYGVHPGGVPTGLAKGMPEHMHEVLVDEPELAGETLAWLTSERREWLRGRYVSVTWDMEEFVKERQRVESGDLLKVRVVV